MSRKLLLSALVAGAMAFSAPTYAQAQERGNDRGPDRGERRFDPSQFRQQIMERMKEQLGASDDEWKVLEPRVTKVMELQRDARSGGFMFSRGGDRGRAPGESAQQSPVQKARADLDSALDDKSVSAEEIQRRLSAYRQAKEQAKADLTKAQADLKELLSQRQEAQLVMAGMLD